MILRRLHDPPIAVRADDPSHGSDREDLARLEKRHGARKGNHLVGHEFSEHTPYLACHYRQNMVGSLPKGMPKVVDCQQIDAQATNKTMTQDRHEVLSRFDRQEDVIPMSYV